MDNQCLSYEELIIYLKLLLFSQRKSHVKFKMYVVDSVLKERCTFTILSIQSENFNFKKDVHRGDSL